jgi:hypothetical protein
MLSYAPIIKPTEGAFGVGDLSATQLPYVNVRSLVFTHKYPALAVLAAGPLSVHLDVYGYAEMCSPSPSTSIPQIATAAFPRKVYYQVLPLDPAGFVALEQSAGSFLAAVVANT